MRNPMADKNVTITIKRPSRPARRPGHGNKRRGPLKGHRKSEILHRRIQGGFINFYDLGSVKSGSVYITRSNSFEPTVTMDGSGLVSIASLTLANYEALANDIMTAGTPGLKNHRKILPADVGSFRITVDIFSDTDSAEFISDSSPDQWSEKGLKLTDDQNHFTAANIIASKAEDGGATWSQNIFFDNLDSGGSIKITRVYDFDAPAAAPLGGLRNGDDVFLMPSLYNNSGSAQTADSTEGPDGNGYGTFATILYNEIYRLLPRDFSNHSAIFSASISDAEWSEALSRSAALSPSRTFTKTLVTEFGELDILTFGSGGAWPVTSFGSRWNADTGHQEATPANGSVGFFGPQVPDSMAGVLLAIVKRGSDYNFVWQTV